MSLDAMMGRIPPNPTIVAPVSPGAPRTLLNAVCRCLPQLGHVRLLCSDLFGRYEWLDEIPAGYEDRITVVVTGGMYVKHERVRMDWTPFSLFDLTTLIDSGAWRTDVALMSLSAPDSHGVCRSSPSVGYMMAAASRAGLVLGEIHPELPSIGGDNEVPLTDLHGWIEGSGEVEVVPKREVGPLYERIGENVAGLISNGSTLQIGVGSVADGIARSLRSHSDLTLHSGFLSDSLLELWECGALTGRMNPVARGELTVTGLLGSRDLYKAADNHRALRLRSPLHINDARVLAGLPTFVSINSAVAADLFGQVNAETVHGTLTNTGSGQLDFTRGTRRSQGGTSIIAMPSTRSGGRESRIVAQLPAGSQVTTHRNDVDFIVTEHGCADLRGTSMRQRASRLIEVADPRFRDELQTSLDNI